MVKKRIGLLVDYCSSEYVIALTQSLHRYCEDNNVQLYVFPVRSIGNLSHKFDYQYLAGAAHITPKNLDGLIIAAGTQIVHMTPENFISYVRSFFPLPCVSIGFEIPGVHSIISDNSSGFANLISHLIQKHHCKKIALMSVEGNSWEGVEREKVFRQTMAQNGLAVDESLVLRGNFNYMSASKALQDYLAEHGSIDFDAIVSLNDDMAYACVDFCRENNLLVPENIIVTGFDDLTRAACSQPTLSTVNQALENQGYLAGEMLYDILDGKDVPMCIKISSYAVYRQSCGCVPLTERYTNYISQDGKKHPFLSLHKIQSVAEWFIKRQQITHVTQFISECQDEIDLSELRKELGTLLQNYTISNAVVCLFTNPIETEEFDYFKLPEDASVLCAFDKERNIFSDDDGFEMQHFNPNESILPPKYMYITKNTKIVIPLFRCKIQYGYMVYEMGSYDVTVYELLCKSLSILISTAVTNTRAEKERASLTEKNEHLDYISRTDELTHVLNRRGFMQLGQQTIDIASSMGQGGIVVYGDMDGLKNINDTYGHEAGDVAIAAEAKLLKSIFRSTDIVGRLGGDEFAVVAVGLNIEDFALIEKRMNALCDEWNENSGQPFTLSISMGATDFSGTNVYLSSVLKIADEKQYQEKRRKKVARK